MERTEYVFTRDYLDNNRINLQHYLWVQLFGYLMHPSLPAGENIRIADVGTGTAIWLTDLAPKLPPSARLDAIDVSFHATPPAQWLPSNITQRQWDISQPVPDDLVGVYDIVHIRNFSFVFEDDDIPNVLANLVGTLKPGGYLQWGEPDVASFRIDKTSATNQTTALTQLLQLSQGQDARLKPTWVPRLASLFRNVGGLESVEQDVRDAPGHMALAMHECNLLIHELIARKAQNAEVKAGLEKLMPEVAAETREGSAWAFTRYTVVGRKPLA